MVEFKRSQISLFLMAALQFAGANRRCSLLIRSGHDVTLPCENVINNQNKCDGTTWNFSGLKGGTDELIKLGQIGENVGVKSDRLSVTENCSLVIKKVTHEDAGFYVCLQYKSGDKRAPDSEVLLSVVSLTEQTNNDEVTLNCSVLTFGRCEHRVKWLFDDRDVNKENKDLRTSESLCSASVHLQTSHHIYTSRFNSLKCEVTEGDKVQPFSFITGPSGEKPGGEKPTKPTTRKTTTTETTTETATRTLQTITAAAPPTTASATPTTSPSSSIKTVSSSNDDPSTNLKNLWWLFIIVALVLVALLIIVVKVIRRQRTKGKKTQMNDNIGLTSNPAETQSAAETSQDTADPEDGVSYASISYTKKSRNEGQVLGKDEHDDEAVTYTTVKASSSSAGASNDLSSLYASIIKPKT